MNIAEIIGKLRDGGALAREDIRFIVKGITDGSANDAQIGAFAMAVLWRGLPGELGVELALAMRDSGEVLAWDLDGPIVDKHSTGGIGDCVSLALAPILAAAGCYVPMISGRGLGHTGGTLDKLEAISGLTTALSPEAMQAQLNATGCVIASASENLAPADKRLYAIRDISGTVPSIDLITASILSKKLAAGLEYLIMDVKCGRGAFMKTQRDARALARRLVEVGNQAGCKTSALLSAMDVPLCGAAGNALEVLEITRILRGEAMDTRLYAITRALIAGLLKASGAKRGDDIHEYIDGLIRSGAAMERFEAMTRAQGGPGDVTAIEASLPKARLTHEIKAGEDGEFAGFDAYEIGMIVVGLGGGRVKPGDDIDHAVGVSHIAKPGPVRKGDLLAVIHANDEARLDEARGRIEAARAEAMKAARAQLPLILEEVE